MLFQYEMKTFFVVLFFGTGDQTPSIPSAILERVFMDPNKHAPPVKTWDMVWSRATQGTDNDSQVAGGDTKGEGVVEKFDELVLAADEDLQEARELEGEADIGGCQALRMVMPDIRTRLKYDAALRSAAREKDRKAQKSFKLAQRNFALLYLIRGYLSDKRQVRMSWI
ncbi:hypothetical protein FIBSPDRAFT_955005 [Athelia psychrophila]|uniref:Uncharacterized protein n=1 Tax=Athelia psychrophila TaxID=1759441 RepID=A0A166ILA5_9AGAM|nr:hypothetical protein FIBSPDRAFT_955005 [Fibularhizoctonia sp. CBS 109695]